MTLSPVISNMKLKHFVANQRAVTSAGSRGLFALIAASRLLRQQENQNDGMAMGIYCWLSDWNGSGMECDCPDSGTLERTQMGQAYYQQEKSR
jgi:hypothetical protein